MCLRTDPVTSLIALSRTLLLPKTSSMPVEADACEADVARDGAPVGCVRQGNAVAL